MHCLPCEIKSCKRLAQYLCRGCGKLVCSLHGSGSDEEAFCLLCALTVALSGAQQDLFRRATNHDQRTRR